MSFIVDRIRRNLGVQKVFLQGYTENEDFTNEVRFLLEVIDSQDKMIKQLEERNNELEEDSFTIIELKTAMEIKNKQLKKVSEEYRNKNRIIESLEEEAIFFKNKLEKIDSLYHDVRVSDEDFVNEVDSILEQCELNTIKE